MVPIGYEVSCQVIASYELSGCKGKQGNVERGNRGVWGGVQFGIAR